MKVGDKVYYIESKKVKEAEVIKITRDFVTLRYKSYVPSGQYGGHMETNGGIRLRISKVYPTKQEAEKHVNDTKR